jgi:hypothetical protein
MTSNTEFQGVERREIIAAWKDGATTLLLNGREYGLTPYSLHGVDYLVVKPTSGPVVPMANLIVDDAQFRRLMEERSTWDPSNPNQKVRTAKVTK